MTQEPNICNEQMKVIIKYQVPYTMLHGSIHSFIFKVFHSFMFGAQSILLLVENLPFMCDLNLSLQAKRLLHLKIGEFPINYPQLLTKGYI